MAALPLHYVTRSAAYDAGEPHYLQLGATADRVVTDKLLAREAADVAAPGESIEFDLGDDLFILPGELEVVDPAQPGSCAVYAGPARSDSNRTSLPIGSIILDLSPRPRAGRLYRNAAGFAAINWFKRVHVLEAAVMFAMEDGSFLEAFK